MFLKCNAYLQLTYKPLIISKKVHIEYNTRASKQNYLGVVPGWVQKSSGLLSGHNLVLRTRNRVCRFLQSSDSGLTNIISGAQVLEFIWFRF